MQIKGGDVPFYLLSFLFQLAFFLCLSLWPIRLLHRLHKWKINQAQVNHFPVTEYNFISRDCNSSQLDWLTESLKQSAAQRETDTKKYTANRLCVWVREKQSESNFLSIRLILRSMSSCSCLSLSRPLMLIQILISSSHAFSFFLSPLHTNTETNKRNRLHWLSFSFLRYKSTLVQSLCTLSTSMNPGSGESITRNMRFDLFESIHFTSD